LLNDNFIFFVGEFFFSLIIKKTKKKKKKFEEQKMLFGSFEGMNLLNDNLIFI